MPNFFSLSHQGGKGNHVKALEVSTVKALEVYTVKALEVSKLFTRGDKHIIPNIGALVNTLYLKT